MERKKAIDLKGLSRSRSSLLGSTESYKDKHVYRGFAGGKLVESVPSYMEAAGENYFHNENNAWIVLGRDRPASRLSGYGGRGDTHAAAIDLVAGRMGHMARAFNDDGERLFADPNFTFDAARVYISQKTDVDDNFKIANGTVGKSKTRSAVAMKADAVRLVAREGMKLVTGGEPINSQGGSIQSIKGIDLIANNDDRDMQPLVKGDNLAEALDRVYEHVKNLTSVLETFLTSQMKYNAAIAGHTHIATAPGSPVLPSIACTTQGIMTTLNQLTRTLASLPLHRTNIEMAKFNYLQPFGSKYINSRHNNTN